jgi:hypothetical protein
VGVHEKAPALAPDYSVALAVVHKGADLSARIGINLDVLERSAVGAVGVVGKLGKGR